MPFPATAWHLGSFILQSLVALVRGVCTASLSLLGHFWKLSARAIREHANSRNNLLACRALGRMRGQSGS